MDTSVPDRALLLVRLRSPQPDGSVVGETQRTCHLVPVPDTEVAPEYLVAYCGQRFGPGAGEVLPSAIGMPCERCMARSRIPAFSMLRPFGSRLGDAKL